MKKSSVIIIISCSAVILAVALTLILALAVFPPAAEFEAEEYTVFDGDSVRANHPARYEIVGECPKGVSVDSSGRFTVDGSAVNGSQAIIAAIVKNKVTDTAVCVIRTDIAVPTIEFVNMTEYLVSGERAVARSVPAYSLIYTLKEDVTGVSIDPVTGRVRYTEAVEDGVQFTVSASAKGVSASKTFKATIDNYVTAVDDTFYVSSDKGGEASFTLDFGNNDRIAQQGVLGITYANREIGADNYTYDDATSTVTIKKTFIAPLESRESEFKIVTAKNSVSVTVKKAIYISSAQEFAKIGADEAYPLNGHYVLTCDIDMTEYLKGCYADDGSGGKYLCGWTPIGIYIDSEDPSVAVSKAFCGTFDGNGHTVSGFYIHRPFPSDTLGYNSGLFGYVTVNGTVKNINLVADPDSAYTEALDGSGKSNEKSYAMRSYSGGLCGVNCGIIENCSVTVSLPVEGLNNVGCFIGRNEGEIRNSYVIGKLPLSYELVDKLDENGQPILDQDGNVVKEEKQSALNLGVFCGNNEGKIENCFAVNTGESKYDKNTPMFGKGEGTGCVLFADAEQMLYSADFSSWSGWIAENGVMPKQKTVGVYLGED